MERNSSCSIPWTSVGAAKTIIERLLPVKFRNFKTSDKTKTTCGKIAGCNDILSSQAFKMAAKMAEYTGGKKRRYFAGGNS